MASDAVENLGFFLLVRFDLETKQREMNEQERILTLVVSPFSPRSFSAKFPPREIGNFLLYLDQRLRKWAFLIFWAADRRNNPVSLLSPETMVGARKCEHFRLGSRGRVLKGKKLRNKMGSFRRDETG